MIVTIADSLVQFFLMILIYNKIHDCNIHKIKALVCSFFILFLKAISYPLPDKEFFILYILSTLVFIISLNISIQKVRFTSLIYTFLLIMFFKLVIYYSAITFVNRLKPHGNELHLIIDAFMLIVCLFCCYTRALYKIKQIISSASKTVKILILLLMVFCLLNIALMSDIHFYVSNDRLFFVIQVISLSSILIMGIAFPIIILISTSNTYLKKLTENYERQIEAQAEHYAALSSSHFELRKFRHDLKNIKIGVGQLLADGRYNEALDALSIAENDIFGGSDSLLSFDTGNGIVDALLADKQKKAETANTKIVFKGAVPQESISATDLCVLFGNTIDNAIEACEKLETESDKTINVSCKVGGGFMFLNMSNPVNEPVAIKNNTLTTTKSDKTLHGFGLYSLDRVIKSHNGEMKLSCTDNVFNLDISMCLY